MGDIWKEKVYTECVRHMGMMKMKEMNVSVVSKPQAGRLDGDKWGGMTMQNYQRLVSKPESLAPDTDFWVLSKVTRKNPKPFKKQSCSGFPLEMSQPVLLQLPTQTEEQGKLLFIKKT